MGLKMGEDDTQIPALFALLNERFAPSKKTYPDKKEGQPKQIDGIAEMVILQEKFNVFRLGEDAPTFRECAALLSLGGALPWNLRRHWYDYLDWLQNGCTSEDDTSIKGGQAICTMLHKNLRSTSIDPPKPIFFMPYHYEVVPPDKPVIKIHDTPPARKPLFYIDEEYWVIELPMKPKSEEKE